MARNDNMSTCRFTSIIFKVANVWFVQAGTSQNWFGWNDSGSFEEVQVILWLFQILLHVWSQSFWKHLHVDQLLAKPIRNEPISSGYIARIGFPGFSRRVESETADVCALCINTVLIKNKKVRSFTWGDAAPTSILACHRLYSSIPTALDLWPYDRAQIQADP